MYLCVCISVYIMCVSAHVYVRVCLCIDTVHSPEIAHTAHTIYITYRIRII